MTGKHTAGLDPQREREPGGRAGAGPHHEPKPHRHQDQGATVDSSGTCEASYYWEPQPTASGEEFDPARGAFREIESLHAGVAHVRYDILAG